MGVMPGHESLFGDLSALGEFFAVETQEPGRPPTPPWQPMTVLVDDSRTLEGRVHAVRTALARRADCPPDGVAIRVAASVAHLGLIARLLAPAIGAFAFARTSIVMSLDALWWQNLLGGPFPLLVRPAPAPQRPTPGSAVEAITSAVRERYGVGSRVLWGNVGSATNSAAQLISVARPDLTIAANAIADHILSDPRIDGGTLRAGPEFRRLSCCLIYRIADDRAAVCGDCVLGSL